MLSEWRHARARLFRQYGHEPRLMAAKFVSPYRMAGKSGKNDAADAQAICEAVRRPHMRFVPVKDESQQAMQCLHRTRQGFIEEKTAANCFDVTKIQTHSLRAA